MKIFFRFLFILITIAAILFSAAFILLPLPGHASVLMYHFVGTQEDAANSKNFVSEKSFDKHMSFLKKYGYHIISIDEYYAAKIGERKARAREVLITFDDGNYTFESKAHPILKKYNFPATVFVVSESMKSKTFGSMAISQIKNLLEQGLISIGSHTKTHPFLSEMSEEAMSEELLGSKRDLKQILNRPISYVAYPYGNMDARVQKAAERVGYKLGFTTSHKKLKGLDVDLFSLTRTKMTRSSDHVFVLWFKVSGLYDFFKGLRYRAGLLTATA